MTDRLKYVAAILSIALGIALLARTPAETKYDNDEDPDDRARCLMVLLAHEGYQGLPNWDYGVALLNYADAQYGGPCAALDYFELNGYW